jgi:mRNA-degrading endonuclease YafQ of YafQ-DinJ toxin-antitoxin module
MNLKKSKPSKKAQLLRDCLKTKEFVKDWAKLSASGRYNLNNLKEVMLLLISLQKKNMESEVRARISSSLKNDASAVLHSLGLSMSDAI